jgi:two-component system response regulator YesN
MYKALVIDDEKPARQAIIALGQWAAAGVTELHEAREGAGGLAVLRDKRPDIVMVDMKMPQMDGVEFLEIACREFPRAKYVVISGYDDYEYTRRAIRANVRDYLLKPVIEAELNEVIQRVVAELNQAKRSVWESLNQENLFGPQVSVLAENGREKQQSRYSLCLYEIKKYIDQYYYREIKLKVFADRFFLSKEYLSKLFKEEFGYNIYEYLLRIRMEQARKLLADLEVKVISVAGRLGYHDQNYFSKAFKTYYGITPTEFREGLTRAASRD